MLRETESLRYEVRTEQNVIDSDATLILGRGTLAGGTLLTRELAVKWGKPCLVVDLTGPEDVQQARHWLREQRVQTLNIAGPRESSAPGIAEDAAAYLRRLLGRA